MLQSAFCYIPLFLCGAQYACQGIETLFEYLFFFRRLAVRQNTDFPLIHSDKGSNLPI